MRLISALLLSVLLAGCAAAAGQTHVIRRDPDLAYYQPGSTPNWFTRFQKNNEDVWMRDKTVNAIGWATREEWHDPMVRQEVARQDALVKMARFRGACGTAIISSDAYYVWQTPEDGTIYVYLRARVERIITPEECPKK